MALRGDKVVCFGFSVFSAVFLTALFSDLNEQQH